MMEKQPSITTQYWMGQVASLLEIIEQLQAKITEFASQHQPPGDDGEKSGAP